MTKTTATPAAVKTSRPKMDWKEAKARVESARATVGYDKTSPIYGKTTLEVIQMVNAIFDDHTVDSAIRIRDARVLITDLQKREAAQKLAFA